MKKVGKVSWKGEGAVIQVSVSVDSGHQAEVDTKNLTAGEVSEVLGRLLDQVLYSLPRVPYFNIKLHQVKTEVGNH